MKRKPIVKTFALISMSLLSILVIVAAAVLSYSLATAATQVDPTRNPYHNPGNGPNRHPEDPGHPPSVQALPDINVLVLGIDNYNLTDTIFVVHFSGTRGTMDVISIPRDSSVSFDDIRDIFASLNRAMPASRYNPFRINEIPNRAAPLNRRAEGIGALQAHVGNILGIEFDYYVTIDLRGLRRIVDALPAGGIYFNVPYRMRYIQGGQIDIDLQEGYQILNGAQAEQLLRFRGTREHDFGRINVGHDFMRAFIEQVITPQAILGNPQAFATAFIAHVNTDFGTQSLSAYLNSGWMDIIDLSNPGFHTAPGALAPRVPNSRTEHYFIDVPAAQQLMRDIESGAARQ